MMIHIFIIYNFISVFLWLNIYVQFLQLRSLQIISSQLKDDTIDVSSNMSAVGEEQVSARSCCYGGRLRSRHWRRRAGRMDDDDEHLHAFDCKDPRYFFSQSLSSSLTQCISRSACGGSIFNPTSHDTTVGILLPRQQNLRIVCALTCVRGKERNQRRAFEEEALKRQREERNYCLKWNKQ